MVAAARGPAACCAEAFTDGRERPTAESFHLVRLQSCIPWERSSFSVILENHGFAVVVNLEVEVVVRAILVLLKRLTMARSQGPQHSGRLRYADRRHAPAPGAFPRPFESYR